MDDMNPGQKLNTSELSLIMDRDFFPAKNKITSKIYLLFTELKNSLKSSQQISSFNFPDGIDLEHGKISKGENLQLFPYIILDFPKKFKKEDIFTFRTLFWWGHNFSFIFQIAGESCNRYGPLLSKNSALLIKRNFYCFIGPDAWQHDPSHKGYVSIDQLDAKAIKAQYSKYGFLKVIRNLRLKDYNKLNCFGLESMNLLLKACKE